MAIRSRALGPAVHRGSRKHHDALLRNQYRLPDHKRRGASWTEISPDLTNGRDSQRHRRGAHQFQYRVQRVRGWQDVRDHQRDRRDRRDLDSRSIAGFPCGISPTSPWTLTRPTTAYIAYSGFTGYPDSLGHIFETTNGGTSWTDISGDLPNTPVDWIVVDPMISGTIYVGTDIGTFYTSSMGTSWSVLGSGLPNVVVSGLGALQGSPRKSARFHAWPQRLGFEHRDSAAVPDITSAFLPPSALVGGAQFTLTVNGGNFDSASAVEWNGAASQLSLCEQRASHRDRPCERSPGRRHFPGDRHELRFRRSCSNAISFAVDNPAPVVTSLSPMSASRAARNSR